jgi:Protein of unknown function (DUF2844)
MTHPAAQRWAHLRLALLLLLVAAIPAWASLGGGVSTVQADQAHMKASLRVTQNTGYTVHEMQSQSGGVVREYVAPSGQVFAVSWQGPFMPDLRQVLGSYFDQFAQVAQARQRHGGPLMIHEPGLVVESGGHMRAFFGRAYVPQMMPQGVSKEAIR